MPSFVPAAAWDVGERVGCLHRTVDAVGDALDLVRVTGFAAATPAELREFHDADFVRSRPDDGWTAAGRTAVGAARELCRQIWRGRVDNGYALVRPSGHHAERATPGGGCAFATGVLAALEARRLGARRVMIVDWDAHHGNSQQSAFWRDPDVLTISVHQDRRWAPGTGGGDARGAGKGRGANLNVPVPPGSGGGVYRAVFDRVIGPAADRFRPDFVLVANGLDGSYLDPSARLCLHSGDYGWMTDRMVAIAAEHAHGRLLLTHEGGYALGYLPLCLLRVLESLSGRRTGIADPFLSRWGDDLAASVPSEAEATLVRCEGHVQDVA